MATTLDRQPPPELPRPGNRDENGQWKDPPTELIDFMVEKFGPTISNKHTQIKALEKLIAQLKQLYPDDWESRLYEILKMAFPDRADELMSQYKKLEEYNAWMKDSRAEIMKMSDVRARLLGSDLTAVGSSSVQAQQVLDREAARWEPVVKRLGLKVD